jgi:hypothetical protein
MQGRDLYSISNIPPIQWDSRPPSVLEHEAATLYPYQQGGCVCASCSSADMRILTCISRKIHRIMLFMRCPRKQPSNHPAYPHSKANQLPIHASISIQLQRGERRGSQRRSIVEARCSFYSFRYGETESLVLCDYCLIYSEIHLNMYFKLWSCNQGIRQGVRVIRILLLTSTGGGSANDIYHEVWKKGDLFRTFQNYRWCIKLRLYPQEYNKGKQFHQKDWEMFIVMNRSSMMWNEWRLFIAKSTIIVVRFIDFGLKKNTKKMRHPSRYTWGFRSV